LLTSILRQRTPQQLCFLAFGWIVSACDPSYHLYVNAHVTDKGKPVKGVWVGTPPGTGEKENPKAGAFTDANGRADIVGGAFLEYPEDLVVAYKDGYRLWVGVHPRDFERKSRSYFFNTEWDAALSIRLQPRDSSHGIGATCEAGRCRFLAPLGPCDSFRSYLLVVRDGKPRLAHFAPTLSPVGVGSVAGTFEVPAQLGSEAALIVILDYTNAGASDYEQNPCPHTREHRFVMALDPVAPPQPAAK
jgi:hypothetical protein